MIVANEAYCSNCEIRYNDKDKPILTTNEHNMTTASCTKCGSRMGYWYFD